MTKRPIIVTAFALAASAGLLVAGPLNPPAGPVAPTYRTLSEVEPRIPIGPATTPGDPDSVYKITQPGSYYITGNLAAGVGLSAIEIAADDVTIDLGGFVVSGSGSQLDGITTRTVARRRVSIRNGTVRGFGAAGIDLSATGLLTQPLASSVMNVVVTDCLSPGIKMVGGLVRDCQAYNCTSGIRVEGTFPGAIEGCTVSGMSFEGINVGNGTIQRCVASGVAGTGISIGNMGAIVDCTAESCEWGFGGANARISGSLARNCTVGGIYSNTRSTITGNTIVSASVVSGTVGIRVLSEGNRVEGNNVLAQSVGVQATGPGNLVVSNSFHSCTNAVNIAAGNRVGAFVVGTFSPAVSGNSGGSLGTSDPYVNLIY